MRPPESERLPKFREPPVNEVVVGVQFETPLFTPVHFGSYYALVRDEYPQVQSHQPLPPVFETFGPNVQAAFLPNIFAQSFMVPAAPAQPRLWFVSKDEVTIIQLQNDRLIFNWRKRDSDYPHFEKVQEGFLRAFSALKKMLEQEGLVPVVPNQCEVHYINHIPVTGDLDSRPENIFNVVSLAANDDWQGVTEEAAFQLKYRLSVEGNDDPVARLTVSATKAPGPTGQEGMRLELGARGRPLGEGEEGFLAFQQLAHRAIVRCFAGITTAEMHRRWGRYQ